MNISISWTKSYATEISVGDDAIPYGLKQRIAIARSFFGMPQVIILDAVTAQLDQRALFDIRNSVLELKKTGQDDYCCHPFSQFSRNHR